MINTEIKLGTLTLTNPVTVASGTAGYGEELSKYIDISRLGALVTKGLSLEPRLGNTGNRIIETPSGVMNSIGLENVGIKRFLSEKLPFLNKTSATVIANVAGHSFEENIELCRILNDAKGISAIELNVSCPNVKEGGISFGKDPVMLGNLTAQARAVTKLPLIVKLTPNAPDIVACARSAKESGADAVSAMNTFLGCKIDIDKKKPYFKNTFAGLSGPAIRPIVLRMVWEIYAQVDIPIIGIGGIQTAEDAIEFMMAGASAISIGAANMVDPCVSIEILEGIIAFCSSHGIHRVSDLIGCAH
ncbi:MAG TPA: dihydroorotate dehydrogenase [Spirochaetota bacterium]